MTDIEEIKQDICDNYCKYPSQVGFGELNDICENCPLNELQENE